MKRKSPKKSITIPEEILKEVERFAASDSRTLSNAIAYLLQKGINVQHQAEQVLKEAEGLAYTTKRKPKQ